MDRLTLTLTLLDYAAVAVFGATGALAAARSRHDIITFGFFAAITGVGGGTLRDLLIDAPVFWVRQPAYIGVSIAAALAVWVVGPRGGLRGRVLSWLDALGLIAYAIVGALKAQSFGCPPVTSVIMGVLTATFGGVIRDVLAHEPSVLLRHELYVTPALVAAATFVAAQLLGAPNVVAEALGFALGFGLRAGAILWGWSLPGFGGPLPDDPP